MKIVSRSVFFIRGFYQRALLTIILTLSQDGFISAGQEPSRRPKISLQTGNSSVSLKSPRKLLFFKLNGEDITKKYYLSTAVYKGVDKKYLIGFFRNSPALNFPSVCP